MAHEEGCEAITHFAVPATARAKCFIPYSPSSTPSLFNVPIIVSDDSGIAPAGHTSIVLARNVVESTVIELDAAFTSLSSRSVPPPTRPEDEPLVLPVTALCIPHMDGIDTSDAAIRYIASQLQADLVVLDPFELAKGPSGIYGEELSSALWDLYSSHYYPPQHDDGQGPPGEEVVASTHSAHGSPSLPISASASTPSPFALNLKLDDNSEESDSVSDSAVPHSSTSHTTPNPPSSAHDPSSSPTLRRAMQAVRALVHVGLDDDATQRQRRIVYLRDFGAFNTVFLPWARALAQSLNEGPPTLVIAGVFPVQQVAVGIPITKPIKPKSQLRRFAALMSLDSSSSSSSEGEEERQSKKRVDFLDGISDRRNCGRFLQSMFCAQWRQALSTSGHFESLEDVFTSAFIHRYCGEGLRKDDRSHTPLYSGSELVFERVVRTCLALPVPQRVREYSLQERRERILDANIYRLSASLRTEGKSLQSPRSHIWSIQDPSAVQFRVELSSRMLSTLEREDIVCGLPAATTIGNLIGAFNADREWRMQIAGERSGTGLQATADPVVVQVRADPTLKKKERELLDCIIDPTTIQTTFKDVCIQPNVIETLRTTVSLPLFYPNAYNCGILSSESSAGVLLYGPPGTGKTMACRALAKECGARMLQITSSTIQRCLVGETEQFITAVFSLARRLGPCVLFIDELDALFGARDGKKPVWHTTALTEFMQEMDGLRTADLNRETGLIVIGATNRPQDLDHAVLRRLPRRILVDLPGLKERSKILEHYLKDEQKDASVDVNVLAKQTRMFSGSDLRHLVLSAAQIALKESIKISWVLGDTKPVQLEEVKPRIITSDHFKQARREISASNAANQKLLDELRRWGKGERIVQDDC